MNIDYNEKYKYNNVIFIEIDKIPDTLKNKKIYKLIKKNCKYSNISIPFPFDIYKKELIITSLIYLINTIEIIYKIKNIVPIMNYEFAILYRDIIVTYIDYLKNIYPESIYLREIDILLNSKSLDELYYSIADNNYTNLLSFVIYKKNNILFK